jgi:hypothetical protein
MKKVVADSFIKVTIIRTPVGTKCTKYVHYKAIECIGEASEDFCRLGGSGTIDLIGSGGNYFVTLESCEEIMEMLRQIVTED